MVNTSSMEERPDFNLVRFILRWQVVAIDAIQIWPKKFCVVIKRSSASSRSAIMAKNRSCIVTAILLEIAKINRLKSCVWSFEYLYGDQSGSFSQLPLWGGQFIRLLLLIPILFLCWMQTWFSPFSLVELCCLSIILINLNINHIITFLGSRSITVVFLMSLKTRDLTSD